MKNFFYLISALIEMYISGSELENFQILTIRGSLLKKMFLEMKVFIRIKNIMSVRNIFFLKNIPEVLTVL